MSTGATGLDTGTYEVLRDRLAAQAAELARRAEELNTRRTAEFGSTRLELTGTERLRTEHTCLPRDIVVIGDVLLFGYGTRPGTTAETAPGKVFALYDRDLNQLAEDAVPGLLDDPAFAREFAALHRYYRDSRLLELRRTEGRLLAVFQTGEKTDDIRVLRWSVSDDGRVSFLDARGERDHVLPASHDVEWVDATREDHIPGRHPHLSIGGEVFVATDGGALTIKAENDTETGEGIYAEPVDEPLQSLADAEIAHARVGVLLLLRIRPYKESAYRHLVFNTLTKAVVRLDGIGQACRRLPEDQGIAFPGGYCLASGAYKVFDVDAPQTAALEFERVVRSPNGEDVLYAFHARAEGRRLLLSYNQIRKEVATPLFCLGWALFDDGTLMVLRHGADDEAARIHPLQLWRSPYVSDTHAAAQPVGSGPLARVGNADLVRGLSDVLSLTLPEVLGSARTGGTSTVAETTPTTEVYEALVAGCVRAADTHHWLADVGLGDLRAPLDAMRATGEEVLSEFEAVLTSTRQAADAVAEAEARIASVVRRLRGEAPRGASAWVAGLTELRQAQGHLLTLKDLRYADTARIDGLAADVEADLATFGQRAIAFLAREDAFTGHHQDIEQLVVDAESITTVAGTAPVSARLDELADGLRTVTEVVAGLDIGDATVRTSVLRRIAEVLGGANRARATLDARRRALVDHEGRAEFAAEFALLGQAVTGSLAVAESPEGCDEQLTHLLVRLEDLESRFAEFDDFLGELSDKRTEVYEAFSARKQTLADARSRRAEQLAASAARVLETLARRAATLADADAVATYFASDPMVAKARGIAEELRELGDPVRAEELEGRLRAARQEASRALRDRTDLYADDGRTIRLGRHRFAVNTQPLDLTLVPQGDGLAFALAGTDYRSPVTDPDFAATRPYWGRLLPSESPETYRAEHLAARLLDEHGPAALAEADLAAFVRSFAEESYDEGYERGIHDHDATAILATLLRLHDGAGLLRHQPAARAVAQLFWAHGTAAESREVWARRAVSLARARETFGLAPAIAEFQAELATAIGGDEAAPAAAYLFDELTCGPDGFVISAGARTLLNKFRHTVGTSAYDEDLAILDDLTSRRQLVEVWLSSYTAATGTDITRGDLAEAVAAELCADLTRYESDAPADRDRRGTARHPPPDHRPRTHRPRRRTTRPHRRLPRPRRPRPPLLPAPAHRPGGRRALAAPPGLLPSQGDVVLRPQPAHRRGVPPPHRRQPRQADRHHGGVQAHRCRRTAPAHLPARIRQDDAHGVRRRPPRSCPGQDQRPGPRSQRHLPGSGRGSERHRTPGDRKDQLRPRGGQQHAPPPRRHPAHLARTAPEVHPAVRRHPPHRRSPGRRAPHLRPARQTLRGLHGRQPLHRIRWPFPGPRHAGQPRRRLEPG